MNLSKIVIVYFLLALSGILLISFTKSENSYSNFYKSSINEFITAQENFIRNIPVSDFNSTATKQSLIQSIHQNRFLLKKIDFWLRYLDPLSYKKINGPLPVEWETEVFEKFEKPYKREGAGLSLAELYLEKETINRDSFVSLITQSVYFAHSYLHDSILNNTQTFQHFYFANRLFLLNLATIYTTGFECPDRTVLVSELKEMLNGVNQIYKQFNQSFPEKLLQANYLDLYKRLISFVEHQSNHIEQFDHFLFIRDYVNPLFALNQKYIKLYAAKTISYNDYTLNDKATSIFDKSLYRGQDILGVYRSITDTSVLNEIRDMGKHLFYDPILSGNNKRACASCHIPQEYFTDTSVITAFEFNHEQKLNRNTPSLINVEYNHLIMLDGKHISLSNQAKSVMMNPNELANNEKEIVEKIMSCKEYKDKLKKFVALSTDESISLRHITSALIYYYSSFSKYESPFDRAMNNKISIDAETKNGFTIFMSKAQCGTCHFAPIFNGVKPPYIGSEFEVLGVPENRLFQRISPDSGRYLVNPAHQTIHAFRTGTIRNASRTKPYMHNGVFTNLDELIEFYDTGGGKGRGLQVENQSLSSDSLKLSKTEKQALLKFILSLDEQIPIEDPPLSLPVSTKKELNRRKIGGEY